jgi:hypothetical protein
MVLRVWNPPEDVKPSPDVLVLRGFHCGTPKALHDLMNGPDPSIVKTPMGEWICRFCTESKTRLDRIDQLPRCPACDGPWEESDFTYKSGETTRFFTCECGAIAEWYLARGWGWFSMPAGVPPSEEQVTAPTISVSCWYCRSTDGFEVIRKRSGKIIRRCVSCRRTQLE